MKVKYLGPSDDIRSSEDAKPVPRGGDIDLEVGVIAILKGAGHQFGEAADRVEPNMAPFNDQTTQRAQQIEADQTAEQKPSSRSRE